MVLGYSEPRPRSEHYESFMNRLVTDLEANSSKLEGLSLMVYGSFVRRDYIPGRSDIDAVLVFPNDVVIDKESFRKIAKIIKRAQRGNNIPFQITPCDLRTMEDGRFNSFDPNFKDYFLKEGRIVFGEDYRNKFRFETAEYSDQNAVRFNLRKSRLGLLMSEQNLQNNYIRFLETFNKTLDSVSRASKQIPGMIDGKLRANRFSALDGLKDIFPRLNMESLERIKHLYHNLDELDALYKNPEEVMEIWDNSVTFFEEMIKAYLDSNPRNK